MDTKKERREFLKKAAYSVPVIATLGSVTAVEACPSCKSPNGNCGTKFGNKIGSKLGNKFKSKFGNNNKYGFGSNFNSKLGDGG